MPRGQTVLATQPCGGGWAFSSGSGNPGQSSELGVMRSEWKRSEGYRSGSTDLSDFTGWVGMC